jgi:hypothetical protein
MSPSRNDWRWSQPPDSDESAPCDTSSLHMRLGTCMIGASHGTSSSNSARAVPLSPTPCGSLPLRSAGTLRDRPALTVVDPLLGIRERLATSNPFHHGGWASRELGSLPSEIQVETCGYPIPRGETCNRCAGRASGWNREPFPRPDAYAARPQIAPRRTPRRYRWCPGGGPGRTPLLRSFSGHLDVDRWIGGLRFGRRHIDRRLLKPGVA